MTAGLHLSNESLIQKNRIVTTPSDYYILTIFTHKKPPKLSLLSA